MTNPIKSNFIQKIDSAFSLFTKNVNGAAGTPIFQKRIKAFDTFVARGLPTVKAEEWKYTNVAFLNAVDFELVTAKSELSIDATKRNEYLIPDLKANVIVIVDGYFRPELSEIISDKLIVSSLKDKIKENQNEIDALFNANLNVEKHPFNAINTALSQDGLYIEVPKNTDIEEPIHIVNINNCTNAQLFVNIRNIIKVGENASAKIVETINTIGENASITSSVSEVYIADNANLQRNALQNDNANSIVFSSVQVNQQKTSRFLNNCISISGRFIRNDVNSVLNGEFSESNFNGFYFVDGKNLVDNHTLFDHAVPNCQSNEVFKGILTEKSTGVFNGKILVRPDAQKTNAYQSSKSILMSNDAKINSKPELEIYADDVKCSHGASSGSIDPDQMFYLRARGLDEMKAKELLLNAYAMEVVNLISIEPLRKEIENRINNRLKF